MIHAGHFQHKHMDTFFLELNVNAQCKFCNIGFRGNLKVYEEQMIQDYGINLVGRIKRHKIKICTRREYIKLIEKYRSLVKE